MSDSIESIKAIDDIFNHLALEVSQYSRGAIKKDIEERIERIKREEKFLPRAKNIQKYRNEKKP